MILFVLMILQVPSVYACYGGVESSIPSCAEPERFDGIMEESRLAKVVQAESLDPYCAEQEGLTELVGESRKVCLLGAACVICTGVISTVVIGVTIAFSYYSASIFGNS